MLAQPGVKSALDMAIHDLAARAAGVPLCTYLGGRYGTAVDLYRSVSQDTPDAMARSVLCVSEDQSLADAANLLATKDVERAPVVKDGVLRGFVTRADLVRRLLGSR